jgi:hypothetical protein
VDFLGFSKLELLQDFDLKLTGKSNVVLLCGVKI